jgi:hypothetical protein
MAAEFTPVLLPEFCQPDETMPFGKLLVRIIKKLKIALPSITGKPINALPTDTRYRIVVHIPGRTFGGYSEAIDFQFTAPTWILGRDMAIHRSLGHLREEYRAELDASDLAMISRRIANGDIVRTLDDDSILSYVQDLETHIRNLEVQTRRSSKIFRKLIFRELELEDKAREDFDEHEEEVKDFLERIKDLKTYIATMEEKMDLGEDLFPSGDDGPLVSNDKDYEESSTEGRTKRRHTTGGRRTRRRTAGGRKDI